MRILVHITIHNFYNWPFPLKLRRLYMDFTPHHFIFKTTEKWVTVRMTPQIYKYESTWILHSFPHLGLTLLRGQPRVARFTNISAITLLQKGAEALPTQDDRKAHLSHSQGVWLVKNTKLMCVLRRHFPRSVPGLKMLGPWCTAASHSW